MKKLFGFLFLLSSLVSVGQNVHLATPPASLVTTNPLTGALNTRPILAAFSVSYATTTNLNSNTYINGTAGLGATLTAANPGALGTIDGVASAVGDTILVKNEGTQSHNGIYIVTTEGNGGTAYVLTRETYSSFAQNNTKGASVYVGAGTANGVTTWYQTTTGPVVMGTTGLVYSEQNLSGGSITGTGTTPYVPWFTATGVQATAPNTMSFLIADSSFNAKRGVFNDVNTLSQSALHVTTHNAGIFPNYGGILLDVSGGTTTPQLMIANGAGDTARLYEWSGHAFVINVGGTASSSLNSLEFMTYDQPIIFNTWGVGGAYQGACLFPDPGTTTGRWTFGPSTSFPAYRVLVEGTEAIQDTTTIDVSNDGYSHLMTGNYQNGTYTPGGWKIFVKNHANQLGYDAVVIDSSANLYLIGGAAYNTVGGLLYTAGAAGSNQVLQTGAGTATTFLHGGTTPAYSTVPLSGLTTNTANTLLGYDASGNPVDVTAGSNVTISAGVISAAGGGGGSPGGSNTQLQYNNSSAFGGISGATSDGTNIFVPNLYGGTGASVTQTFTATNNGSPTLENYQFGGTSGLLFQSLNSKTYLSVGFTAATVAYSLGLKNTTSGNDVGIELEDNYAGTGTGNVNDNFIDGLGKYGIYITHNYSPNNGSFLNEAASGNQSKANFIALGGSSTLSGGFAYGTFANGSSTKLFPFYITLPSSTGQANTIISGGLASPTNYASSVFTVESTTQGAINAPSMTTTQQNAISSPQEGLRVYDNVLHVPAYYNGTAWVDLPTSGTYTPTLTNTTNITSSTVNQAATYTRIGNIIHVNIACIITPTTASTATVLTFTLPFTTSNGSPVNIGSAALDINSGGVGTYTSGIVSLASTTTATLSFNCTSLAGSSNVNIQFDYSL